MKIAIILISATAIIFAMDMPAMAVEPEFARISLKTFGVLVVIVIGLFVMAWAMKRYGPVARVKKNLGLNILGQVALSTRANLALVSVGKSILLLGVTQNNISLIKDLEQGDFEKAIGEFNIKQDVQ